MRILYVTRHFNQSGYLILRRLIRENFEISAVLLHQDNDRWRKEFFRPLLILCYWIKTVYYRCKPLRTINSEERLAKQAGIPIIWAESIKSVQFFADLQKLNPDIIVLGGGWHELIPERVYSFPKLGCINTHPSLLPEFRGTSITRWQVLHGVKKSGSTIHYVDNTFDTGGVLIQGELSIPENTTPQELFYLLGQLGANLMVLLLRQFLNGQKLLPYPVDHNLEYYQYFSKWQWNEEALTIDWAKPLHEIHAFVLANTQESYEYLGPVIQYKGKKYFLRETAYLEKDNTEMENLNSGLKVVGIAGGNVSLARQGTNSPILIMKKVQYYDDHYKWRRSYSANSLLNLKIGDILNEQLT